MRSACYDRLRLTVLQVKGVIKEDSTITLIYLFNLLGHKGERHQSRGEKL